LSGSFVGHGHELNNPLRRNAVRLIISQKYHFPIKKNERSRMALTHYDSAGQKKKLKTREKMTFEEPN
jgi:hypothetical protein